MGGPACTEERTGHDGAEQEDENEDRQRRPDPVRHMHGREDPAAGHVSDDDPSQDETTGGHQAAKPGVPAALTGSGDVGAAQNGVTDDSGHRMCFLDRRHALGADGNFAVCPFILHERRIAGPPGILRMGLRSGCS